MYPFPDLLIQLHQIDFDYEDGNGIDFEPYEKFLSEQETLDWFKSWTGNNEINATQFLVFGQDGTGGYAAFWLINKDKDIFQQPIVFLGSEGQIGVVAKNFNDYLWLLAQNYGASETIISFPDHPIKENIHFFKFAQKHAKLSYRTIIEIIDDAKKTYPTFENWIDSLVR